jgi:serine O-acetyltransferase
VAQNSGHEKARACDQCDQQASYITEQFLEHIPELRRMLALDVQAAFDGDPAAVSTDETIFCYPGLDAVFVHRLAHVLFQLEVPLLPRMMTECVHNETGIDIHPGAEIGESFFIDHGTGVVIGETTKIGNRVKIYQGVTLGALSTKGGQAWRGRKRHPTIEDDVTIYGGAIILGGATVIGTGSTIGGSVFITKSVPPHHAVSMKDPRLEVKELGSRKQRQQRREEAGRDFVI